MSRRLMVQVDDTAIPLLKKQYINNHDILFFVSSDSSPKFLNLYYVDKNTNGIMHCFVRTNPAAFSNEEVVGRELLFRGVFEELMPQPNQNEAIHQELRKQHLYNCIAKHQAIFNCEELNALKEEESISPKSPAQLSRTGSYASQHTFSPTETEKTPEQNQRSQPLPIIPKTPSSPIIFKQPAQLPSPSPKTDDTKNQKKKNEKCPSKCTMC